MSEYYDFNDQPCTMETWAKLWKEARITRRLAEGGWTEPEDDPSRVGSTKIGDYMVSTVWLGLNHSFRPDSPPTIYETLVFGDEPWGDYMVRYSTRAQAAEGHQVGV